MSDLGDFLTALPVCVGLTPEERERLASVLVPVSVKKGDAVFKEASPSNAMYLLAKGKVEVRLLSRPKPIATLKAPTVFGEMGVLTSSPHSATIMAATPIELYALSSERFDALVKAAEPLAFKIGLNLARLLADRLREVDLQLEGRTAGEFTSVRERLLRDWSY